MWEGDVWVAVRAARAGAEVVSAGFLTEFETELKSEVDPVTALDRDAERPERFSIPLIKSSTFAAVGLKIFIVLIGRMAQIASMWLRA